jgi:hypothetical protein
MMSLGFLSVGLSLEDEELENVTSSVGCFSPARNRKNASFQIISTVKRFNKKKLSKNIFVLT